MRWDLYVRYLLEYIILYPAALLCYLPMRKHLGMGWKQLVGLLSVIITCAVLFSALMCTLMLSRANAMLMPVLVGMFFVYRNTISKDVSLGKAMYVFTTMASLLAAATMLTSLLTASAELHNPDPTVLPTTSMVCLGLDLLMVAVVYPIVRPWMDWMVDAFYFQRTWRIAWLVPASFTVLYVLMMPQDKATVLVNRVQWLGIVLVLAGLLVQLFLMYLLYRMAREIETNARLTAENQLLTLESRRYDEMRHHLEETRMLRHDFRQHLRVITNLSGANQTAQLAEYLHQLEETLSGNHPILCQNPAVDAVAGYYHQWAEKRHVPIEWKLSLPQDLPMPEPDICMLLGNLLENALTASDQLPPEQRRIKVICQMLSPAMLGLIVENAYNGVVKWDGKRLLSTRHDGMGVGLQSVEATVHRYHGKLEVDPGKDVFEVHVLLNL